MSVCQQTIRLVSDCHQYLHMKKNENECLWLILASLSLPHHPAPKSRHIELFLIMKAQPVAQTYF